eukprot:g608.t1
MLACVRRSVHRDLLTAPTQKQTATKKSRAKVTGAANTIMKSRAKVTGAANTIMKSRAKVTGAANINTKSGAKVTGAANINTKSGAKVTGAANINTKSGAKVTGAANINTKSGAKVTGAANINTKSRTKVTGAAMSQCPAPLLVQMICSKLLVVSAHLPQHKQLRRLADNPAKLGEAEAQLATGEYVKVRKQLATICNGIGPRLHPSHIRALAFRQQELKEQEQRRVQAEAGKAAHQEKMECVHAYLELLVKPEAELKIRMSEEEEAEKITERKLEQLQMVHAENEELNAWKAGLQWVHQIFGADETSAAEQRQREEQDRVTQLQRRTVLLGRCVGKEFGAKSSKAEPKLAQTTVVAEQLTQGSLADNSSLMALLKERKKEAKSKAQKQQQKEDAALKAAIKEAKEAKKLVQLASTSLKRAEKAEKVLVIVEPLRGSTTQLKLPKHTTAKQIVAQLGAFFGVPKHAPRWEVQLGGESLPPDAKVCLARDDLLRMRLCAPLRGGTKSAPAAAATNASDETETNAGLKNAKYQIRNLNGKLTVVDDSKPGQAAKISNFRTKYSAPTGSAADGTDFGHLVSWSAILCKSILNNPQRDKQWVPNNDFKGKYAKKAEDNECWLDEPKTDKLLKFMNTQQNGWIKRKLANANPHLGEVRKYPTNGTTIHDLFKQPTKSDDDILDKSIQKHVLGVLTQSDSNNSDEFEPDGVYVIPLQEKEWKEHQGGAMHPWHWEFVAVRLYEQARLFVESSEDDCPSEVRDLALNLYSKIDYFGKAQTSETPLSREQEILIKHSGKIVKWTEKDSTPRFEMNPLPQVLSWCLEMMHTVKFVYTMEVDTNETKKLVETVALAYLQKLQDGDEEEKEVSQEELETVFGSSTAFPTQWQTAREDLSKEHREENDKLEQFVLGKLFAEEEDGPLQKAVLEKVFSPEEESYTPGAGAAGGDAADNASKFLDFVKGKFQTRRFRPGSILFACATVSKLSAEQDNEFKSLLKPLPLKPTETWGVEQLCDHLAKGGGAGTDSNTDGHNARAAKERARESAKKHQEETARKAEQLRDQMKERYAQLQAFAESHRLRPKQLSDPLKQEKLNLSTEDRLSVGQLLQVVAGGKGLAGIIPTRAEWSQPRRLRPLASTEEAELTYTPYAKQLEIESESMSRARGVTTYIDVCGFSSTSTEESSESWEFLGLGSSETSSSADSSNASDETSGVSVGEQLQQKKAHSISKSISTMQITLPPIERLWLSSAAISALKRILNLGLGTFQAPNSVFHTPAKDRKRLDVDDQAELARAVRNFFESFGSHVFQGPVLLGANVHVRAETVCEEFMDAAQLTSICSRVCSSEFSSGSGSSFDGSTVGKALQAAGKAGSEAGPYGMIAGAVAGAVGGALSTFKAESAQGNARMTDSTRGHTRSSESETESSRTRTKTEWSWMGGKAEPDVGGWTQGVYLDDKTLDVVDRGDCLISLWDIIKASPEMLLDDNKANPELEELELTKEDLKKITSNEFSVREFQPGRYRMIKDMELNELSSASILGAQLNGVSFKFKDELKNLREAMENVRKVSAGDERGEDEKEKLSLLQSFQELEHQLKKGTSVGPRTGTKKLHKGDIICSSVRIAHVDPSKQVELRKVKTGESVAEGTGESVNNIFNVGVPRESGEGQQTSEDQLSSEHSPTTQPGATDLLVRVYRIKSEDAHRILSLADFLKKEYFALYGSDSYCDICGSHVLPAKLHEHKARCEASTSAKMLEIDKYIFNCSHGIYELGYQMHLKDGSFSPKNKSLGFYLRDIKCQICGQPYDAIDESSHICSAVPFMGAFAFDSGAAAVTPEGMCCDMHSPREVRQKFIPFDRKLPPAWEMPLREGRVLRSFETCKYLNDETKEKIVDIELEDRRALIDRHTKLKANTSIRQATSQKCSKQQHMDKADYWWVT